jgi:hypothetical protein
MRADGSSQARDPARIRGRKAAPLNPKATN